MQIYFIIYEKTSGAAADSAYCNQIKNQYGMTFPVLLDHNHNFKAKMGFSGIPNAWSAIVGDGGKLLYREKYGSKNSAIQWMDALTAN